MNINKTVVPDIHIPISILVAAYNTSRYIEQCLDSIVNQTYFINNDNYEILVGVDNCEETLSKVLEIKHKYKNIKIIKLIKNVGTYKVVNTLIKLSKYDVLVRFDSDDIMNENLITVAIKYINNYDIIRYNTISLTSAHTYNAKYKFLSNGSFIFSKNVLKVLGGFKPWKIIADKEFLVRAENYNFKIKILDDILYKHRIRNDSLTYSVKTNRVSKIREKYIKRIEETIDNKSYSYERIYAIKHVKYYNANESKVINVIIPFKNVDNTRKRNLIFTINYYKKHIQNNKRLNIIVVEQDTDTDLSSIKNINHIKLKLYSDFSRGICFNIGVKHSIGNNLILSDSDVLLDTHVFIHIYKHFNYNFFTIPYDQPVIYLTEDETKKIINKHDIDLESAGNQYEYLSKGGVGLIDKRLYCKLGGFDEFFIGWGVEDEMFNYIAEHVSAVKRLNYKLYHLNHKISDKVKKEQSRKKHKKYYYAIKELNNVDLLLYIKQQQALNFKNNYINNKFYILNNKY